MLLELEIRDFVVIFSSLPVKITPNSPAAQALRTYSAIPDLIPAHVMEFVNPRV
jgi:hypothetical protein